MTMLQTVEIDRPDDPRLADYTRLTDAALRTHLEAEQGLFIAEGTKVITRAVAAGYPVRSMLLARSRLIDVPALSAAAAEGARSAHGSVRADGGVSMVESGSPEAESTAHSANGSVSADGSVRADGGVSVVEGNLPEAESAARGADGGVRAADNAVDGGKGSAGRAVEDIPVYVVPDEVAERLTGYRVHRGALASLARRPLPGVAALISGCRRIVVLEDLVDHANVGAIFRCAAALGVDAVVLSPRCADPLYRRSVKVSMGAVFAIPYARMTGWYDGLAEVREAGFRVLALTPDEGATPIGAALGDGAGGRVALVFGTEGDGLSGRWLREADEAVRIPMNPAARAAGVDSLNVVAAAAIACHLLATAA
jgi:tRNA G18 (ribose-2'-O)-methylase SpoU